MLKKSLRKNIFPVNIYLTFLIIVAMVFGGLGGYFLYQKERASNQHGLILEINRLYSQLTSQKLSQKQFFEENHSGNNELRGSAGEIGHDGAVHKEARFNDCRHISNFMYQKWYKDLIKESKSYGVDISKSTSACFSDDSALLVYLIPAEELCQPADIYRYDVKQNQLSKARYLQGPEGCLGALKQFWYRDGKIINLVGYRKQDNCELFDYFGYDYLKNTFEFTKRIRSCK